MQSKSLNTLIVFGIFAMLAYLVGKLVLSNQHGTIATFLAVIILLIFGLKAKTETLIFLTFYALLAGSSYKLDVRKTVFYLRFGLMFIYLLRIFPLWGQLKFQDRAVFLKRFSGPFHVSMSLFCFVALASSLYSVDPNLTLQRAVALWILFGAIFIYLFIESSTYQKMQSFIQTMVLSTALFLIFGYLIFLGGMSDATQGEGRLRLLLFSPNQLGYICAILFPAAFWFYAEAKPGWTRLAKGFVALMFVATIFLTASRGAIVTLAFSGMILVFFSYRKLFGIYAVVAFTLVAVTYIFVPPTADGFLNVFESQVVRTDTLATGSGRLPIWEHAMKVASQRRYFGYGFGTIRTLFNNGVFAPVLGDFQGHTVHSSYIELYLDLGLAGVLSLGLCLIILLTSGVRAVIELWNEPDKRNFGTMLLCCILSGITSAVFESWLNSPGNIFSFPFWVCAVCLLNFANLARSKQGDAFEKNEN